MNKTSGDQGDIISRGEISRMGEFQLKTRQYTATNDYKGMTRSSTISCLFGVCL